LGGRGEESGHFSVQPADGDRGTRQVSSLRRAEPVADVIRQPEPSSSRSKDRWNGHESSDTGRHLARRRPR